MEPTAERIAPPLRAHYAMATDSSSDSPGAAAHREDRMAPDGADAWIAAWGVEAATIGIEPGSDHWTLGLE